MILISHTKRTRLNILEKKCYTMGTMGLLLVNFTRPPLGKAVCFTRAPCSDFGLRQSFYLCVAFLRC